VTATFCGSIGRELDSTARSYTLAAVRMNSRIYSKHPARVSKKESF